MSTNHITTKSKVSLLLLAQDVHFLRTPSHSKSTAYLASLKLHFFILFSLTHKLLCILHVFGASLLYCYAQAFNC